MEQPESNVTPPLEDNRKLVIITIPEALLASLRSTWAAKAYGSLLGRIQGKHPGLKALTTWAWDTLHPSFALLSLKANNLFEVTFTILEGRIHALTQTELTSCMKGDKITIATQNTRCLGQDFAGRRKHKEIKHLFNHTTNKHSPTSRNEKAWTSMSQTSTLCRAQRGIQSMEWSLILCSNWPLQRRNMHCTDGKHGNYHYKSWSSVPRHRTIRDNQTQPTPTPWNH